MTMKEQIISKMNDKKQAIVRVDEKLVVLRRSLEAKQFSVSQMQSKQDRQWDALRRIEKLYVDIARREDEATMLREQMRSLVDSEPVDERGKLPEGVEPVIETDGYKSLKGQYDLLMKINDEALSEVNRIYYGKA